MNQRFNGRDMELTKEQQERFRRSLKVEGFGPEEQCRLLRSRVAVVGAGGLGSAALSYLVAAGVGHLTLVEFDRVSLSNLQRQILYTTADLGEPKAEVAAMRLSRMHPGCEIRVEDRRLTEACAEEILAGHDAVVDCTDNYETRYLIDDCCGRLAIPMIYGTAEQMGGQVSVFHTASSGSYRALYPERPDSLSEVGVFPPLVGVIGSLQALETLKWLGKGRSSLEGVLFVMDGTTLQCQCFQIGR